MDISLIIEEYLRKGKIFRIVIRSEHKNYFLDLPVNSFLSRSFLITTIFVIKIVSLLSHGFNVAVSKLTVDNVF
jgi:hypothetical protein